MSKLFYIIPLITTMFLLSSCEGYYRYPCQDPANWGNLECNNTVCQAEGTCTSIVLARAGTLEQDSYDSGDSADLENFASSDENGINTTCAPASESAAVVNYAGKGEQPRDFRVKNKMVQEPDTDTIEAIDEATESQEVPLTMNTVVDTAAHNAATR